MITYGCFYEGNLDMSERCISEGLKSCMRAERRPNLKKKLIIVKNAYLLTINAIFSTALFTTV